MTIESREVLADARVKKGDDNARHLRHAVEVDADGNETRVLCNRVKLDSLADRYAGDPHAAPTCERCLAALRASVKS